MNPKPPTAKTARDAILARGKALYPHGIGPDEMMQLGGRPYPTRIGELKEAGWSWEAVYDGIDPRPSYRLTSLVRGEADPVSWGLRARLGASTGLKVTTYGTSTLVLPEGEEARILARVEAVIREELAKAKVDVTGTVAHVVEEEDDLDDGFGWQPSPLPPEAEGWDGDPYGGDEEWEDGESGDGDE